MLVLTSGGVISRLAQSALGASDRSAVDLNLSLRNSALSEFHARPYGLALGSWNALPHLHDAARAVDILLNTPDQTQGGAMSTLFPMSERVRALDARLAAFMDAHVLPAEADFAAWDADPATALDRFRRCSRN